MKWISTKDRLPEFKKDVLIWVMYGHRWQNEIGALHDTNGDNGKTEWIGMGGRIIEIPNKEFPSNLKWNIGGHWEDFDKCSYWMSLPNPPQKI